MKMKKNRQLLIAAAFLLIIISNAIVAIAQSQSPHQPSSSYLSQRVYDSDKKKFSDFETMIAELTRADVVFVGEKHDDPATHKLERAILEGLLRRKVPVTVAMEMFERDVQLMLNDYLAGKITEENFLKDSRPWPNYATDYRPLVEMARTHSWQVVGSNVPRRYASQISRQGLGVVNSMPEAERKMVAAQIQCPFDDYFKRFNEAMSGHPGDDAKSGEKKAEKKDEKKEAEQRAMVEKFYFAQCVKDETMAESIVAQFNQTSNQANQVSNSQRQSVIVHYNGAFHSDYKLGTAARVIRRLPKAKVKIISIIPVNDLDSINPDEYRKRGDYVVFCLQPAKTPMKAKDAPAN